MARRDERDLVVLRRGAAASASAAPRVGVELAPFDVPLEDQRPRRVVLAEDRPAGDEDVVEPAGRIDERQPGVHRDVQLAIVLESGGRAAGRCCAARIRRASTR